MSSPSFGASTYRTRAPSLESVGLTVSSLVGVAFGVLICATPWAYGGVEDWYRAMISAVLGILVILAALTSLLTMPVIRLRSVVLIMTPLVALGAIGGWQWGAGLLPLNPPGIWFAGTIYPGATELAIAGLLTAAAAAFLGATVFSRDEMFVVLVVTCLAAATAVGFLGIGMRLSGDDRVIRGIVVMGTPFARFVNRNNAAAFLLVGVSCGIALMTSLLRDRHSPRSLGSLLARRTGIDRQTLLIISLILTAIPLAGIVASASRGGTISAAVVVMTGIGLLGTFGKWRWALLLAPALGLALALAVWLGLSERTLSRFQSLSWHEIVTSGRVPHWLDAVHSIQARPIFGSGLGTYGYAYQEHSERETFGWFQHADNEFVELAVESGAAGLACLIGGLLVLVWAVSRSGSRPAERTLIVCLAAGELAHAIFDYGIVIPATVLPAAALMGAAALRLLSSENTSLFPTPKWVTRASLAGMGLMLAAGLAWASAAQQNAWAVDEPATGMELAQGRNAIAPAELKRKIEGLTAALEHRPQDAEGHRLLAGLYVYRYRTTLAARLAEDSLNLDESEAWRATSMTAVHRVVNQIADAAILPNLIRMRQDELVQRDLVPAMKHYKAAASACPRLPDIRIPMQALVFLDTEKDLRDTEQIEIAARLFPADASLMRTMARMAWASHNHSLAGVCWRNAFAVSSEDLTDDLAFVAEELGASEAVALIWPERAQVPGALAVEAARLRDKTLRVAVGRRLLKSARNRNRQDDRQIMEAYGTWLLGEEKLATESFQQILAGSPQNTDLRVSFAKLLWLSGDFKMAIQELRQAIWLDSDRFGTRKLLARWISHEESVRRDQ